jgi:uncharacterized protein (TIGR02147 family)
MQSAQALVTTSQEKFVENTSEQEKVTQEPAVTYRDIIKEEFSQRRRRNPRYSLRAFARDLKLSPSMLCDVINGNHGLSRAGAAKVALAMNLSPQETDYFCDLVESLDARSAMKREMARIRLLRYNNRGRLSRTDTLNVVSDWYHSAILQLFDLEGFSSDPEWIARNLGISKTEVEVALERLQRLGFVSKRTDGSLERHRQSVTVPEQEIPASALRAFNDQILEKAKEALFTQGSDDQEVAARAFCIDRSSLPLAKKMLRDFQESFGVCLSNTKSKDSLYLLSMQFFAATPRQT